MSTGASARQAEGHIKANFKVWVEGDGAFAELRITGFKGAALHQLVDRYQNATDPAQAAQLRDQRVREVFGE